MKGTLDQMNEIEDFRNFLKFFSRSANYFAAVRGNAHALDLCLAHAYKYAFMAQLLQNFNIGVNTHEKKDLHHSLPD